MVAKLIDVYMDTVCLGEGPRALLVTTKHPILECGGSGD